MQETPIQFDDQSIDHAIMLCPLCRGSYTHVDDVHIGGRPKEDGLWENVQVNSAGCVKKNVYDGEMASPPNLSLRRHYITLLGNCEECGGRFALHFTQHKGNTFVSASKPAWIQVSPTCW